MEDLEFGMLRLVAAPFVFDAPALVLVQGVLPGRGDALALQLLERPLVGRLHRSYSPQTARSRSEISPRVARCRTESRISGTRLPSPSRRLLQAAQGCGGRRGVPLFAYAAHAFDLPRFGGGIDGEELGIP